MTVEEFSGIGGLFIMLWASGWVTGWSFKFVRQVVERAFGAGSG